VLSTHQLPGSLSLESKRLCTPWWAASIDGLARLSQLTHVKIKFRYRAAQSVSMHTELLGCLALIPIVLNEDVAYKDPLELAYSFTVKDAALVHLRDQD
jgi:hypothetical protein